MIRLKALIKEIRSDNPEEFISNLTLGDKQKYKLFPNMKERIGYEVDGGMDALYDEMTSVEKKMIDRLKRIGVTFDTTYIDFNPPRTQGKRIINILSFSAIGTDSNGEKIAILCTKETKTGWNGTLYVNGKSINTYNYMRQHQNLKCKKSITSALNSILPETCTISVEIKQREKGEYYPEFDKGLDNKFIIIISNYDDSFLSKEEAISIYDKLVKNKGIISKVLHSFSKYEHYITLTTERYSVVSIDTEKLSPNKHTKITKL